MYIKHFIDPYIPRSSSIHNLDPHLKVLTTFTLMVFIILLPKSSWEIYSMVFLFLLLISIVANIALRFLIRRILLASPFLFGIGFLSIFQEGGTRTAADILIKSLLCIISVLVLSASTSITDISRSLKRLKLPSIFVTSLLLMYRYLFVIYEEMQILARAKKSRTFSNNRAVCWRDSATIISSLFLRTVKRSERIYMAMCARYWNL